nr:DUF917 domain-containing protein [Sedimentibacter sp.]
MNKFELKTQEDIDDFLTGCAFFGTGGGGNVSTGRDALTESLNKGYKLTLMDPKEIQNDDIFCTVCFMGSIAPKTPEILNEMKKTGFVNRIYSPTEMLVNAVDNMEKYIGKKVTGLYVAELGGSNSACCMAAAYHKGIPVIDGDCSGRAVPEMGQGLPSINEKNFLPVTFVDSWGNTTITTSAFSNSAMERIGKMVSEASYGELAEAACLMDGKDVKESLVYYTLSQCLEVGRNIRTARKKGENPCKAGAEAAKGYFIGKGKIIKKEAENREGYYWGTYTVEGIDDLKGKNYKIWFKNENHVMWENDKPMAASPDMIILLRWRDGEPLSNTNISEGEEIGIIVVPAREEFLSDNAIAAFGPRYFGFDFDYNPIVRI